MKWHNHTLYSIVWKKNYSTLSHNITTWRMLWAQAKGLYAKILNMKLKYM